MATYHLAPAATGVQQQTFGNGDRHPNQPFDTTDIITYPIDVHAVRVRNDSGRGYLFVTVNGGEPSPGEIGTPRTAETMTLDAGQFAELVLHPLPTGTGTTIKVRRCHPVFESSNSRINTSGGYALPMANTIYGLATSYSVEAQLEPGDDWPAPPAPLTP